MNARMKGWEWDWRLTLGLTLGVLEGTLGLSLQVAGCSLNLQNGGNVSTTQIYFNQLHIHRGLQARDAAARLILMHEGDSAAFTCQYKVILNHLRAQARRKLTESSFLMTL